MHVSNYKLPLYYLLGFTVDPLTGFYREPSGRVWLGQLELELEIMFYTEQIIHLESAIYINAHYEL